MSSPLQMLASQDQNPFVGFATSDVGIFVGGALFTWVLKLIGDKLRSRDEDRVWRRAQRMDAHLSLLTGLDRWLHRQSLGVDLDVLDKEVYPEIATGRVKVDLFGSEKTIRSSRTAQLAVMEWAAPGGSGAAVASDFQMARQARDAYVTAVRDELDIPGSSSTDPIGGTEAETGTC